MISFNFDIALTSLDQYELEKEIYDGLSIHDKLTFKTKFLLYLFTSTMTLYSYVN